MSRSTTNHLHLARLGLALCLWIGIGCDPSVASPPEPEPESQSPRAHSESPSASSEPVSESKPSQVESPASTTSRPESSDDSAEEKEPSGTVTRKPPLLRAQSTDRGGILGRQAPAFELDHWIGAKGEPRDPPVTLEDLRGKFVFMLFWQSWCPGCHKRGFPTLKKVTEHFADDDRVVGLGVQTVFEGHSINTADKIHEVRGKFDLNVPMAHDDGSQHGQNRSYLMDRYHTGGTPWIVIIDPSGRVVFNNFHIPPERAIEYLETHTG